MMVRVAGSWAPIGEAPKDGSVVTVVGDRWRMYPYGAVHIAGKWWWPAGPARQQGPHIVSFEPQPKEYWRPQ